MRAVVWHGRHDVRVETVADPAIEEPGDAIVRITSTGLCGSDLHLYEVMAPFMTPGDIVGHEPMGVVEAVGSGVQRFAARRPRRRAVQHLVWLMLHVLLRTPVAVRGDPEPRMGNGRQSVRLQQALRSGAGSAGRAASSAAADYGPISVPPGPPDDRFVYLSDVLPTAWQAVRYAGAPASTPWLVIGLGPIGDMCCRIAQHVGVETVDWRSTSSTTGWNGAAGVGVTVLDGREYDGEGGLLDVVQEFTGGRGAGRGDQAVGMEAHGAPLPPPRHKAIGAAARALSAKLMLQRRESIGYPR